MTVTEDGPATGDVVYEPGAEEVFGPDGETAHGPGFDPERLAVCLAVLEELDRLEVDHPDAVKVRRATSHIRAPKSPFTAITATSPSETVFTNAASMPPEPVALSGSVRAFDVPQTVRRPSQTRSRRSMKAGSRWPSTGQESAAMASG